MTKANQQEVLQFLEKEFPQSLTHCEILEIGNKSSKVLFHVDEQQLRPGGTISGPTVMTLADLALYIAILGEIGIVSLAVTTNLNINFLRKPEGNKNLIGECNLIKVGTKLIYGEVWIYSDQLKDPVAHVTATYALP